MQCNSKKTNEVDELDEMQRNPKRLRRLPKHLDNATVMEMVVDRPVLAHKGSFKVYVYTVTLDHVKAEFDNRFGDYQYNIMQTITSSRSE